MIFVLKICILLGCQNVQPVNLNLATRLDNALAQMIKDSAHSKKVKLPINLADAVLAARQYQSAPRFSALRVETEFFQAAYDIDFEANMKRMTDVFHYETTAPPSGQWQKLIGLPEYERLLSDLIEARTRTLSALALLYDQFQRQSTLDVLVNLPVDGSDGEDLTAIIGDYWPANKLPLVRAASHSANGVRNLASSLFDTYITTENKRQRAYRTNVEAYLNSLRNSQYPKISHTASRVLREFKQIIKDVQ